MRLSKSIVQKMTNIVNDILFKISSKNIDIINLENDDQKSNSESSASAKKTSKFKNAKNIENNNDMFSFSFFFFRWERSELITTSNDENNSNSITKFNFKKHSLYDVDENENINKKAKIEKTVSSKQT